MYEMLRDGCSFQVSATEIEFFKAPKEKLRPARFFRSLREVRVKQAAGTGGADEEELKLTKSGFCSFCCCGATLFIFFLDLNLVQTPLIHRILFNIMNRCYSSRKCSSSLGSSFESEWRGTCCNFPYSCGWNQHGKCDWHVLADPLFVADTGIK